MKLFLPTPTQSLSLSLSLSIPAIFYINGPTPDSFSFIFGLSNFFTSNQCEKLHLVYSDGIRTQDLQNMSLLP